MPNEQKQHVDFYRKINLRRRLLKHAEPGGVVYVPFLGDGDIAADLYLGTGRQIYGADIDPERIATARERLPGANLTVGDCDAWPFANLPTEPVTVADFDAYAYPYASFRSFWESGCPKAERLAVFFTDAQRLPLCWGNISFFDKNEIVKIDTLSERRKINASYLKNYVMPDFEKYIHPYTISSRKSYNRHMMTYWGGVLELNKDDTTFASDPGDAFDLYLAAVKEGKGHLIAAEEAGFAAADVAELRSDPDVVQQIAEAEEYARQAVWAALHEAAVSGNVRAQELYIKLAGNTGQSAQSAEPPGNPTAWTEDDLIRSLLA